MENFLSSGPERFCRKRVAIKRKSLTSLSDIPRALAVCFVEEAFSLPFPKVVKKVEEEGSACVEEGGVQGSGSGM